MFDRKQKQARLDSLAVATKRVMANDTLTTQQKSDFLDRVEAESDQIITELKNDKYARDVFYATDDMLGGNRYGGIGMKGIKAKGNAPLGITEEALHALHHATVTRTSFSTKGFADASGLLPAELAPNVLGPQHENRLIDALPSMVIQQPSYEYIRHNSTSGTPAVVGIGQPKPELVLNTDTVVATVSKIAAHAAVAHESVLDWANFASYVMGELQRQVIDTENHEILNGVGAGHVTGLIATPNILSHTVTSETALDAIEMAIAELRVGAALAVADLCVLHPATWSSIRRGKDLQNRYLTSVDPTQGEANTVWGVPVLVTTVCPEGEGVLLDSTKFGAVLVREPLNILTGTNGDDLVHNLQRYVCEERLALAVERPAAVCHLTGLSTPSGS